MHTSEVHLDKQALEHNSGALYRFVEKSLNKATVGAMEVNSIQALVSNVQPPANHHMPNPESKKMNQLECLQRPSHTHCTYRRSILHTLQSQMPQACESSEWQPQFCSPTRLSCLHVENVPQSVIIDL